MLKTQPMVGIGIPFLIASFVASFFIPIQICFLIGLITVVLIFVAIFYKSKQAISVVVSLVACLVAFSSYSLKMVYEINRVAPLANQEVEISAIITNEFKNAKGTYGYHIKVIDCSQDVPKEFKTILYSATKLDADLYDQVTAKVLFNEISSTSSFDTKEYYKQDEIYVIAFLKEQISVQRQVNKPIMCGIKKLNKMLCERVDTHLTGDEAGLVKAMLLGERSGISKLTMRSFSHSGMVHIISISGLHIAILAAIFLWLLKRMKINYIVCRIVTIIMVWIFVALTNFNVSTVRAGVMLTILLCGNIFGRPANSLNSLFLSGVLIVGINPFTIRDVGFMMTFLATLGLITCARKLSNYFVERLTIQNKVLKLVFDSFACTVTATVFLMPIYITVFGGISIVAPFVNLIAVPLTPVILIMGILLLITSSITALAPLVNAIADLLSVALKILQNTADFFSNLPFDYIGIDYAFIKLWFFISCLVMIIVFWKAKRYFNQFILCSFSLLFVMTLGGQLLTRNDVIITTISTYQAQAVVMTYRGRATVIETQSDGYINQSVAKYLDNKNIRSIEDFIVLESQTKSMHDFAFLTQVKPIRNLYMDEKNVLHDYCKNNLANTSKIRLFQQEQRTETIGNIKVKIDGEKENRTVWLNVYNQLICISNSLEVAQKVKCEFLYFTIKKSKQPEHFYANCVIILNKYDNKIREYRNKIFMAYDNRYSLVINKSGSYQLQVIK